MEYQSNFHAYDVKGINRDSWEAQIAVEHYRITERLLKSNKTILLADGSLPPLQLGNVSSSKNLNILTDFYRTEQQFVKGDVNLTKRALYYSGTAREIRNKKQFPVIGSLHQELRRLRPRIDPLLNDILLYGIYAIYLMACDPDRFLVGLKDGVHWKKANIAVNPLGEEPAIFNMATHYLPMLSRIGKRELTVVPDSLIHPNNLLARRVRLSASHLAIEEILEDAYFQQRYLVPHTGAEVRFRKAGDLARMEVIKSGNELLAKLMTSYGEEQVILDLNEASYVVPDRQLLKAGQQSSWATSVAETYHDLVTAEEISITRYKRLRAKRDEVKYHELTDLSGDMDDPQIIYIPRQVRIKEYIDPRPPYDGPPRPMKPHVVTNYFRSVNMTPKHRDEILKLEREWGLAAGEIVNNVPAGKTWVRPHFSPRGSEAIMKVGPIFIKRKILSETGIKLKPSFPKSL